MSNSDKPLNLDKDIQRLISLLKDAKYINNEKINNSLHALESDFFKSVRFVYETFYNSLGNQNIKARSAAASKATVAAFAAAYGHTHPRVIKLQKGETGLGFNVMGGKEQRSPILVSKIISGGAAEQQGELKRGDQLLSINRVNIENEFHEKAVDLLKNTSDEVCLIVRYMPSMLKDMEEKFERLKLRTSVD